MTPLTFALGCLAGAAIATALILIWDARSHLRREELAQTVNNHARHLNRIENELDTIRHRNARQTNRTTNQEQP